MMDHMANPASAFRRTVLIVALLNLAYFGIEFAVARAIGSVSLFADSVDFLEDTSINLLIFFAAGWTAHRRSIIGSALAVIILVPGVATVVTAIVKILHPVPPEPVPLSLAALGALLVNVACAVLLVRHRSHPGSLARAAWLSARNDALADVAIIGVGVLTLFFATGWLDIVVGLGIAVLNADAAWKVWKLARAERLEPRPEA